MMSFACKLQYGENLGILRLCSHGCSLYCGSKEKQYDQLGVEVSSEWRTMMEGSREGDDTSRPGKMISFQH